MTLAAWLRVLLKREYWLSETSIKELDKVFAVELQGTDDEVIWAELIRAQWLCTSLRDAHLLDRDEEYCASLEAKTLRRRVEQFAKIKPARFWIQHGRPFLGQSPDVVKGFDDEVRQKRLRFDGEVYCAA